MFVVPDSQLKHLQVHKPRFQIHLISNSFILLVIEKSINKMKSQRATKLGWKPEKAIMFEASTERCRVCASAFYGLENGTSVSPRKRSSCLFFILIIIRNVKARVRAANDFSL